METSLPSRFIHVTPLIAFGVGTCIAASTVHASEAEATFKTRCGDCHGVRDIQRWGRQRPDVDARRAWLDQFLRRHYPPPEAERAVIVDHIQSTIAAARAQR